MDTHPPVPVLVSMALAAESVAVIEIDLLSGHQPQFVAVLQVMAVQAPALVLGMILQFDIRVFLFEHPALRIRFDLRVAVGAGEDPLRKRRRRNHIVLGLRLRGGEPELPATGVSCNRPEEQERCRAIFHVRPHMVWKKSNGITIRGSGQPDRERRIDCRIPSRCVGSVFSRTTSFRHITMNGWPPSRFARRPTLPNDYHS